MPRKTYVRKYPPGARPRRCGGRAKGTLNRSTILLGELLTNSFHDLQEGTPGENGDFKDWVREDRAEFYKLFLRLMPRPADPTPSSATDPDWASTWANASPEWRRQVIDGVIPYPEWMPPLESGDD